MLITDAAAVSGRDRPARRRTILLADDHVLARYGLRRLIADLYGDELCLEADTFETVLDAARCNPAIDLALINVQMPGTQGGYRLIELAARYPNIPVVIVSTQPSPARLRRIMSIRTVRAFVPRYADTCRLVHAIETALEGRKVATSWIEQDDRPATPALTPRQEQIHALLRGGLTNKRIAEKLGIKEGTVKNHVSDILRTLKATNRTHAAWLDFSSE